MTEDKDNRNDLQGPDPFISQNVWLKRLGLFILIIGLFPGFFPGLFPESPDIVEKIFRFLLIAAIVTYGIKQLKDVIKSFWNS